MGIRLALVVGFLASWSAVAAAYTVENTQDHGVGSLREQILMANGDGAPGEAVIQFNPDVTGTIRLETPLDMVTVPMRINGPGADKLTIDASATTPRSTVLTANASLKLIDLTITGGMNTSGIGGGILVQGGAMTQLDGIVISGNTATQGGGVYADGTLVIKHSTISNNTGDGAIFCAGGGSVIESTIADNIGTGVVFASPADGTLTIERSTVSGNVAPAAEIGGLRIQKGTVIITNTTFANNTGGKGGDFWTFNDGILNLINATAAGSSAPVVLFDTQATVTLTNTLLAGAGANCIDHLTMSFGYNLASDSTCGFTLPNDKSNVDPLLSPLAANGGPTKTCALTAGSPAANAGGGIDVPETDQRGFPRVQFGAPDIGALEVTEPVITVQPLAKDVIVGETLTLSVAAQNQNSATPLRFQWRKAGVPITGATAATYSKSAKLEDAGTYDVFVLNDGGILTSVAVMVNVTTRDTGGMAGAPGDNGGCCSATGGNAWSSGVLALVVAALLGQSRRFRRSGRPRSANHRRAD